MSSFALNVKGSIFTLGTVAHKCYIVYSHRLEIAMRNLIFALPVCVTLAACADLSNPCYNGNPAFWPQWQKESCAAQGLPGPSFLLVRGLARDLFFSLPSVQNDTISGPGGRTAVTSYCSDLGCSYTVK